MDSNDTLVKEPVTPDRLEVIVVLGSLKDEAGGVDIISEILEMEEDDVLEALSGMLNVDVVTEVGDELFCLTDKGRTLYNAIRHAVVKIAELEEG